MKMPGNMQDMMKQAQQMQAAHAGRDRADPRGSLGGRRHGDREDGRPQELLRVKIDPEVAGDVEMLQDMVLAACNEALKKVEEETQKKMGGMLGGMGLPPGLF